MPTTAPYGSWRSPVSAMIAATSGHFGLSLLQAEKGYSYWLHLRPEEKGRSVLVQRAPDGTISEPLAPTVNVRSTIHEYGGGSYRVADEIIYFVDYADQRIYRQHRDTPTAEAITPIPDIPKGLRYADMRVTPDGRFLFCVRESHQPEGEPVNELIRLDLGSLEIAVVATGEDFYSTPRISPDGSQIACLSWNHPNMPWDGTRLWLATLDAQGDMGGARVVAGGAEESVFQPEWSPDGDLYFVSDRTGWWNLYREGQDTTLAPTESEWGVPQWVFDWSRYAFLPNSDVVALVSKDGRDTLEHLSSTWTLPLAPYTALGALAVIDDNRILLTAAAPDKAPEIILYNWRDEHIEVVYAPAPPAENREFISVGQPVSFPTADGTTAHAIYYPPHNPHFTAPEGELPPLVVFVHGGPTSQRKAVLSWEIQYWTTRGFAVVDVNYGGSTGYGRPYRERLRGMWGMVDVDDSVAAAQYLIEQGLADPERVAIRGGSAGGYTTLRAITATDFFAAGASYFGISDLEQMVLDTHKFESRYLDGLIAPYPADKAVYKERSPLNSIEKTACPVLILQGMEDKVVPPNQAELMVNALDERGLPYAYLTFDNEGHGFRHADNIVKATEAELSFYAQVFGFEPADELTPLVIENPEK